MEEILMLFGRLRSVRKPEVHWVIGFAIGLLGLPGISSAAQLTGSVSTQVPGSINITAEGFFDWGLWDYQTSGANAGSGAPSNRKVAGAAISSMTAIMGTPRGITGTLTAPRYTYTDGTSPAAQTNVLAGAITDTTLNTVGAGWRLSITGDPAVERTVKVFVSAFASRGEMTATLNGATTYMNSTINGGTGRALGFYTFTFQPDAVGDTLNLQYVIDTVGGSNANVDLQAVTVGIPEPASLGVIGLGGMVLLRRRRARS
jgi:hypothetical protein